MQATEELSHEHRVIEIVLDALEGMAQEVEAGRPLDRARAAKALEVLREFADKCHHGKEERQLFAHLYEVGFPRDSGPVAAMLHDHGEGRRQVQAMTHAVEVPASPEADREFAAHAGEYVTLLRAHILREERVLFPMADHMLSPETDAQLMEGFEQIERAEIGEGAHERYHAMAHELGESSRREAA